MSDTTPREKLAQKIAEALNVDHAPDGTVTRADAFFWDASLSDAKAAVEVMIRAGWRPPARVVTTVEEAEALQDGTLIVDRDGDGGQVCDHHVRYPENDIVSASAAINRYGPLTVLWEPEEGE